VSSRAPDVIRIRHATGSGTAAACLQRARSGTTAPFAQIRQGDGRAVGVTAYWDPRFWPGRSELSAELCAVEIGGTWLAASAPC